MTAKLADFTSKIHKFEIWLCFFVCDLSWETKDKHEVLCNVAFAFMIEFRIDSCQVEHSQNTKLITVKQQDFVCMVYIGGKGFSL